MKQLFSFNTIVVIIITLLVVNSFITTSRIKELETAIVQIETTTVNAAQLIEKTGSR